MVFIFLRPQYKQFQNGFKCLYTLHKTVGVIFLVVYDFIQCDVKYWKTEKESQMLLVREFLNFCYVLCYGIRIGIYAVMRCISDPVWFLSSNGMDSPDMWK